MDGSQKLPQRALTPWIILHQQNKNPRALSILVAGWLHYVIKNIGDEQNISDPLLPLFIEAISGQHPAWQQALSLLKIESIFGELNNDPDFVEEIKNAFTRIDSLGIEETIAHLLSGKI